MDWKVMLKKHEKLSKLHEQLLMGNIHHFYIDFLDSFLFIDFNSWSKIEGLHLLHNPDVSVVAVGSDEFNIYYLLDGLHAKGWHLNGLQSPAG
jgi:hypothetical protein